ncbi:MAG TPA: response regulator [Burkholderiaceae bacterium]|nr:response regulator [Burkholderiaceae bacterium]
MLPHDLLSNPHGGVRGDPRTLSGFADQNATRPVRVLLVDDDPVCTDAVSTLLDLFGYEVYVAHDGAEGLRVARQCHPDCALLDLRMGDINGIELAQCLRAEPGGEDMVLIAASGWRHDGIEKQVYAAGFDHYLTKPVDPKRLFNLLPRRGID